GNVGNKNGNVVNENVQENVGNVIVNGNWVGCSYKELLACNPKEYDGKGGVVVLIRWIKKIEYVHDMSGCSIDQKVKYTVGKFVGKALTWWNSQIRTLSWELESELWNHAMVRAGHAAYTDRFYELARLVPHLVTSESRMIESIDQKVKYTVGKFVGKALTWWNSQIRTLSWEVTLSMSWNDFNFMIIQEFCPSHVMQKLESELWNHAMVRAGHAAYTDRFYELARLVPHLVTSESRMIERNGSIKKVEKRGNVGKPSKDKSGRDDNKRTRTENVFATTVDPIGRENTGHLAKDCRGMPRNVNHVNAKNPLVRACYECGSTDHVSLS
nr:reverse transcriptase domain-containing protein [Tanacetum cinerariifolium]